MGYTVSLRAIRNVVFVPLISCPGKNIRAAVESAVEVAGGFSLVFALAVGLERGGRADNSCSALEALGDCRGM